MSTVSGNWLLISRTLVIIFVGFSKSVSLIVTVTGDPSDGVNVTETSLTSFGLSTFTMKVVIIAVCVAKVNKYHPVNITVDS